MTRVLATFALLLSCTAHAAKPYVSLGIGHAFEEAQADLFGVSFPTRCDGLLYRDPAMRPSDPACTDQTGRSKFDRAFDFDQGTTATAAAGFERGRLRLEVEFAHRAHGDATQPVLTLEDNPALLSKRHEWNPNVPPYHRISSLEVRHLMVNAYYPFTSGSAWTPFVGVGAGVGQARWRHYAFYARASLADGYVAAVGGDPNAPEEWMLAAAGSVSVVDADVEDSVVGFQVLAGLERRIGNRTSLVGTVRRSWFDAFSTYHGWETVRSHAGVQPDGVTLYRDRHTLDRVGGIALTIGIRTTL